MSDAATSGSPAPAAGSDDSSDAGTAAADAVQRLVQRWAHRSKCGVPLVTAAAWSEVESDCKLLIDVRSAGERAVSRIPGSITADEYYALPLEQVRRSTVAVSCTCGARSGAFADLLQAADPSDRPARVYNHAGILSHTVSGPGAALESDTGPTSRVHVFAAPFDVIGPGFESTMYNVFQAAWNGFLWALWGPPRRPR